MKAICSVDTSAIDAGIGRLFRLSGETRRYAIRLPPTVQGGVKKKRNFLAGHVAGGEKIRILTVLMCVYRANYGFFLPHLTRQYLL